MLHHKLPTKFLKSVSKNFGRDPGRALHLSSFSVNYRPTNYNLQRCKFLKFWKIPEIASTVEFLFPEAGAKRFSERPASVPQKDSSMAVLLRSFLTFSKQPFFEKVSMHTELSLNIKMSLNIKKSLNIKISLNIKMSLNIKKSLKISFTEYEKVS